LRSRSSPKRASQPMITVPKFLGDDDGPAVRSFAPLVLAYQYPGGTGRLASKAKQKIERHDRRLSGAPFLFARILAVNHFQK
jgi:hypothetical protein